MTPLPRQWSTTYKCQTLTLTNNYLRVTYKGLGKTHKDAASVRTDHPIPAACGIYYYEVKIISKGRDGYMGIGLSKFDVNLNRLPGWDKNSYGYHGDDGHSFCCSGTGQTYGPTFTTGDVIGCCLNMIENTCFYTKNGFNLGIAFRDLPSDLYPTVGLQTPSESVEANFGQYPFEFDIHNYVKEWHLKTRQSIERFPFKKDNEANSPTVLRRLISTYLVHHGYSATAEAFAKSVGHVYEEELASIRNRQKIQKAVLSGQIGQAIDLTYQLFPGILENNSNLLFALKVRQFIEMIHSAHSDTSYNSTSMSQKAISTQNMHVDSECQSNQNSVNSYVTPKTAPIVTSSELISTAATSNEEAMETDSLNQSNNSEKSVHSLDSILAFGRELSQMQLKISQEQGENPLNKKLLLDAFSLLAYHDPSNSPFGFQLDPAQRESISNMLNGAILEANHMPRIPPLEVLYGQTNECLRLMSKNNVPWCAYVSLSDYMTS